jgi:antitoxin VapB
MQLNIKDDEVRDLAVQLSKLTGMSLTATIKSALQEKLDRDTRELTRDERFNKIMEIGRLYAALPDKDTRTAEEILGYDENGLPT